MTYQQLFEKIRQKPMSEAQFYTYVKNIGGLYADIASELELLKGSGAPLYVQKHNGESYFSLSTQHQEWQKGNLVFVDIETNGAKPQQCQIIEIGALKVKGGEIIDKFESYVYADEVPENITQLTGICQADIAYAPSIKEVLGEFRAFLGTDVFVAHNVNFDYGFVDYHLRQCSLFGLLNPKLCTIELAKKTILSPRYALGFLNEFLGIRTAVTHRAYADALTSFRVFEIASMMFPPFVKSMQDLIDFSKGRLKLDYTTPFIYQNKH
ncbi:3'-5' exonuclease [Helicobacter sp. MIT 03-1614]|uniref:3'-5' exonuclease n=1 Tax=Helicobacter sp. MIT 03-1614 TaxID=1548147 RepID=UPI000513685B|nr:3'-5' exonuclease [Helicobacter sp. MIT 03-1614]TLD86602.1 3'-5' exonuclease [Helicobacter sp. MIT 03-1614]